MAPLPSISQKLATLSKRDFETDTWRIILGVIGAFLFLGLIGILAGWWRHHSIEKQQKLKSRSQRGSYAKLEDGRYSLDDLETSNGLRVLRLQRTISTSSSSSSDSSKASVRETERRSRHDRHLQPSLQHPRSQSLCILPIATRRGQSSSPYVDTKGQSCSARPSTDSFEPLQTVPLVAPQILPPPQAAYMEANMTTYNVQDRTRILMDTRSPSPVPLVLSRSISMLRPRSMSLGR